MSKFEKVSYENFKKDVVKIFGGKYSEKEIQAAYDLITVPSRADIGSAGYDFRAPFAFKLSRFNKRVKIPTGIKAHLNEDSVLLMAPRSGKGCSTGYSLTNTVGVIDASYYNNEDNEGDIIICLSRGHKNAAFGAGDRFIQGIILKFESTETDSDAENLRRKKRTGGFGSSGK